MSIILVVSPLNKGCEIVLYLMKEPSRHMCNTYFSLFNFLRFHTYIKQRYVLISIQTRNVILNNSDPLLSSVLLGSFPFLYVLLPYFFFLFLITSLPNFFLSHSFCLSFTFYLFPLALIFSLLSSPSPSPSSTRSHLYHYISLTF